MIPKGHQLPETISYGLYFLGVAHYHQNELQIAEEKLTAVIKDFYPHNTVNFAHSTFVLALIYQARGQPDKAGEINGALMDFAIDTNNTFIQNLARAFGAELALRQERLSVASQWLKRFSANPFLPPYRFYMPQMTAVKILLAQDTTDSLRQAADLLDQLMIFSHRSTITVFRLMCWPCKRCSMMAGARIRLHWANCPRRLTWQNRVVSYAFSWTWDPQWPIC